ncbi:MAG: sensor histidine kinase, partial [Candidatus Omnitrophota bacterium]
QEELNIFYRLATNTAAALKGAQLASDLRDAQADFIGMEKFATIGRLAASTKHEVNNPLNMVYGSFQHGLRALKNTRDGFSGFRAWMRTTIDRINALSPALAAAGKSAGLHVLDEAVSALDRESADHDKFQKELGGYYSHVAELEKEIEKTADKAKNKKEKDELEELSYLFETVKNIISRVKDRDVLMESILNRGFANARRINTGLDAIYRLPKEVGKGLSPIEVKDIMDASLVFARQQAYWETLTDTLVVKNIPGHLPRIKGYYNRLMSVFSNLFINAYQVMPKKPPLPPGERVIKISARVSPDNPGFVEIRVANRGPLIPRENLELIFNHGFTTKKGGSGIGLYISKIQVEVFNKGRIYVRNIEEFGPEFVVELPVWKEKEDEKK